MWCAAHKRHYGMAGHDGGERTISIVASDSVNLRNGMI
jgi:hypothetical protein